MGRVSDRPLVLELDPVPDVETALATGYGGNAWTEALIMKGTAP